MKRLLQFILPLAIITTAVWMMKGLIASRDEPVRRKPPTAQLRIEAITPTPSSFKFKVPTRGNVRPRTQSTLIPEVSGTIVDVSPSLREGGFFKRGDILLGVDPLDYLTAVTVAKGAIAQAEAALEQEKAVAKQAVENWNRLGKKGEPNPLARREPQLAEADANLATARAGLDKAKRDLERTKIVAPYDGRVLELTADVGQYVSPGNVVARIYATDIAEVRLPLTNDQIAHVDLPELYEGEPPNPGTKRPTVTLSGAIGGKTYQWQGEIVRVAGAIDEASRQLFVVAQVSNPYVRQDDGRPPLKIGLFVEAEIDGKTLKNVLVLPREAVRAGDELILVNKQAQTLLRHPSTPVWRDRDNVVIPAGTLPENHALCITPIPFPADGAKVLATIDGKAPPEPERPKKPGPPA